MVDGLDSLRRCDCSLCRRVKPAAVTATVADLRVEAGAEALTLYQFNTQTAKHWFCRICGVHVHHQRRSDPSQMGVNVGCIDGVSPRLAGEAEWNDGITHPSDRV